MTTLLAIDTAADICSVAITHDNTCHQLKSPGARKHAADVLPMVQSLLDEAALTLSRMDAIVIVSGPGSFTGLRIGAAVAQGLSFGADIPIIRISALAMQTRAAFLACGASRGTTAVFHLCMHAREDEFYFASYQDDGESQPIAVIDDRISDSASIMAALVVQPEDTRLHFCAGSGWLQPSLQSAVDSSEVLVLLTGIETDATTLCDLGKLAFVAGQIENAGDALPVYLKEDMAYRKS